MLLAQPMHDERAGRRPSNDSRNGLMKSGEREFFRGPIEAAWQTGREEIAKGRGDEVAEEVELAVREDFKGGTPVHGSFRRRVRQAGTAARGGIHLARSGIDIICVGR